ncbi:DNA breaking-rejoining protein [Salmonella enterica subsp. enterica serovar Anecho]|nr:DNA breaking-rejoining protein [Salmonella enterica subsp. enterica serovar Anecho]
MEFFYVVKATQKSGKQDATVWFTAKSEARANLMLDVVLEDAEIETGRGKDYARPIRTNFPVVNELPPEGEISFTFTNYYRLGEDGMTWEQIPGVTLPSSEAAAAARQHIVDGVDTETGEVLEDHTENFGNESNSPDQATAPAPELTVVATMPLRHRVLAQHIGEGEYLYHVDASQKKEILRLEMDTDNSYVQNLILAAENVEPFKKAIEHDIHKAVNAYKQVFPVDGKVPELCTTIKFFKEWFSAEHINRGLLVKEWAERLKNKPAPVKKTGPHKVIVDDVNKPERPRRSEKPTHRTINYELACGFCEELDLNNLRPAMDFAKRIIAEDREDWKRMSMTVGIIPDIKGYDRQTIIDLVRKAPKAVHNGNPDLRRTWCESFLAIHGVRDPDWYEYVPDNTPTTHEENAARLRQAGKCLRDIEAGRFQCDEEKQHPTGELADEPATPKAVEQDTTEHHPDPQPLENEPPVSQTEAGYQKIRAELHEARKNIPPKNPVDVGKQLAAARGEYVEGISDPDDPKWVKTETSPRTNKPEIVTKVANGIFDVTALLKGSSIHGEKQEVETTVSEPEMPETKPEPQYTWPEYFEPGRYEGVPNDIYHAANGISSTMVKDARVSLMYYEGRHVSKTIKKERSKVLDMGNLVHVLALQPEILDAEFSIEPEIPEGALTTTATIRAVIDEYNASLTPQLSADEIKTLLEEYNSSLPAPVPLGGDKDVIGVAYLELPDDFKRIVGDDKNFTASTMKACIKEYNATLPPQVRTSGNRDALLEQLAIINPDLVAQEAQKPQPLKVSGAKADLIQAVKSVKPDAVFADELLDAWRENPGNKILVTRQQYETALAIQSALYAHQEAGKLLQNPTRAVEVSYFGIDDDTGLDIRVRPDVELEYEGLRIGFDLKTISMWDVKEDSLKSRLHREITMRDYHLSAGMYCNVADLDKFAWIFVNKDEGYHWVAVVWASDSLLELGKLEYRRTIRAIANAMDTGEWPAPVTADYTDELNDYDLRRLEALREMA